MNSKEKGKVISIYYPKVGEKLYLSQITGNCMVDMVKIPYTVISVDNVSVGIQRCELVYNGPMYYDTIADVIKENPEGKVLELRWYPKKGMWGVDEYKTGYPDFAFFGEWKHQPYLD